MTDMTIKAGDKLTFTEKHKALVHGLPRKKSERAPTWVDGVVTVVRVEAEGWMITVTAEGWDGAKGCSRTCFVGHAK